MNLKRLFVFFAIIIFTIFLVTSYSPELAIRKHLFFVNPAQSLTCNIGKTNFVDKKYGQQYTINGFIDPESGNGIFFAYVKKNFIGTYYWSGGGSGP
ncbi:MAG: hypothetical protein A4E55_00390 [Pelotomaculum sp. PtaU1.Bin035]|nr:MAG: hypothetical protein A4E55_00390 [Pelotomaculum sp. PtaU1.Bin035]